MEGLGLATFGLLSARRKVRPLASRTVLARGPEPAALAVAFLNELILTFQIDGFLAREIRVRRCSGRAVEAVLRGEPFDPDRHSRGIEVKAATMHRARFDPAAGVARIILDI